MAMMISKFHRIIQSKVVWYVILGVIILAFVAFFTPSIGSGGGTPSDNVAGELFGKKVMASEFRQAYLKTGLWYGMLTGQSPDSIKGEAADAFYNGAWSRLAAIRKAEKQGIIVSDDEVADLIRSNFVGKDGKYDPETYKSWLESRSISSGQMESLLREQIIIQKLVNQPTLAALISPSDLQRTYHQFTDRFIVDYALLPRDEIAKDVEVTDADAKEVFDENKEQFRVPAKVAVSYVEWKVDDFLDQAEPATDELALQWYNHNRELYKISSTNNVAQYKPFEEVKEKLEDFIHRSNAMKLASEAATAFVSDVAPKSEGELPDFAAVAKKDGLEIKSVAAFSASDDLDGIDKTASFRQAAFRLEDGPQSSFSDAVVGKDSVYVLSLDKRIDSFTPTFEEVKDDALVLARMKKVAAALVARAKGLSDELSSAISDGKSFEEALKPYNVKIETTEEFDLDNPPKDNPYSYQLLSVCLNKEKGELGLPVAVEDGVLVSYVAERKKTDIDVGLPAIREELINGLSKNRSNLLVEEWQESLLKEAGFKDYSKE